MDLAIDQFDHGVPSMIAVRSLRVPFFIVAVMLLVAAVSFEIGSTWLLTSTQSANASAVQSQLGIPALWLLDVSLLWALILMSLSIVFNKNTIARAQGIVTLILSIVIVIFGIAVLFKAFTLLLVMIALVSSVFGWLIYLPLFGDFGTTAAALALGTITFFKFACAALLVAAEQRFLENKGLVILLALSLLCDLILSILHGFPPGVLVSITDAIGAIVIAIIAIVYAIFQAVWAVVAIARAIV